MSKAKTTPNAFQRWMVRDMSCVLTLKTATVPFGPVDVWSRSGDLLWTPVAGTLAMAALRRLLWAADDGHERVDLRELAVALGVGAPTTEDLGVHAPVTRAVSRLRMFRLLRTSPTGLVVSSSVPRPEPHHFEQRRTFTWEPLEPHTAMPVGA